MDFKNFVKYVINLFGIDIYVLRNEFIKGELQIHESIDVFVDCMERLGFTIIILSKVLLRS